MPYRSEHKAQTRERIVHVAPLPTSNAATARKISFRKLLKYYKINWHQ
jgi:hypothetical protein